MILYFSYFIDISISFTPESQSIEIRENNGAAQPVLELSEPVDCCSTISVWVRVEEMEATRKYFLFYYVYLFYVNDGGIPGDDILRSDHYIRVLFPGGTTKATFAVHTRDDVLFEPSESFHISIDPLSLPHGVVIGSIPRTTVTIMDDEGK